MTLDQLQRRDRRIAELDAIPPAFRDAVVRDELASLTAARDHFWRRLPAAQARARRKAEDLDAYGRQHRMIFE